MSSLRILPGAVTVTLTNCGSVRRCNCNPYIVVLESEKSRAHHKPEPRSEV